MTLSRRQLLQLPALLPLLPRMSSEAPERPNLVFILADQHNARALSCYGHSVVQTPNLDRLAAGGVRFENAFCTTPQCDPARLSIQTGRYARSHGVVLNRVPYRGQDEFLPQAFQRSGYATFAVGKRPHVASAERFGFDRWSGFTLYRREHGKSGWQPKPDDRLPVDLYGSVGPSPYPNERHPAGHWTSKAIEFLREKRKQPFVLWLSYYGPHTPIVPSEPFASLYDPAELELPPNFTTSGGPAELLKLRERQAISPELHKRVLANYLGLVTQIDFNVGRVLDELDSLGVTRNTIVVYVSDHGEMMAEHGGWTKAALLYDSLVRVPLIVRYPEALPAGRVEQALVSTIDLKPGLMRLAKLEGNSEATPAEGHDLFDVEHGREEIFAEFGDPAAKEWHCLMVRTRTHKYVRHTIPTGHTEEFFDLQEDPWEKHNLVSQGGEVLAMLRQKLANWEQSVSYSWTEPIVQEESPTKRKR